MNDTPDTPARGRNGTGSPPAIDTTIAHPARVWDYWLGGKDNYLADRELGDQILQAMPDWVMFAQADREFLGRTIRYLAGEAGIRQFLDIGTGLPTANNTHEVAQAVVPDARIVYVDNDPVVLVHAQALLRSTAPGVTDYIHADLNDPDSILRGAAETLDLTRPVAITLLGIVEFITDTEEAYALVNRLLDAVPSGSHLVIAHPTTDVQGEAMTKILRMWNSSAATPATFRTRQEFTGFFERLELVEPGVTTLPQWRPDTDTRYTDREIGFFGAMGRKP
ncbi:SAM-dependent methyltransferase [Allosalinactinospora lopnorensis]|uniref:SAM-dependent methyltransferase n=1 Tax=Allosalinactinospora lopnorensis TaxID=1352348 RepID=UPI000623EAD3|nr:SAM-dependent methyltransferase [Allosalinactinospora lopnorensis]